MTALIAWIRRNSARLVAAAALVAVLGGVALAALDHHRPADWLWAATTAMLLVPLTWSVLRSLRRGDVGVDAIALVSMAGALALGEYLAGAVVALMLAGGNALEESANRRARRELTALVERAPRSALVRRGDELRRGAGRRRRRRRPRARPRGRGRPGRRDGRERRGDRRRVGADRRAAAGHGPSRRAASAAARPRPARRSSCARCGRPPRAPTPRSCAWSSRPRSERAPFVRIADRYATVLPARDDDRRRASRGPSPAIRFAPSPSSSSRRRAR